jgi:ABC-type glycerol-3-phosphate transport system substrate-binding protein
MTRKMTRGAILGIAAMAISFLAVVAAPAEAQVKIRFQTWHWNETPWVNSLNEFMRTFNAANPGIEVVRDDSRYGDKEAVFTTQSQARAAADIPHFSYRPIRHFAERGYLLDLTPFIEKEGGAKYLAQWDASALEICKYKGKIYCLPDDLNPLVLMYNTVHFKEAGLDPAKPPATWDQFLDYARKLTRAGRYGVGILGARQEGVFMRFNPWLWGAGGDYLTPDEKRSALDTPAALEGFKFYVELFTKHKVVPPGVIEQGAQEVRTQLAHEKVSMIITLPAAPGIVQAINPKMNVREVMALAPVPVGKKKVTSAWFSVRVISAFTKNPDAAWKVYRTWMDSESQMRNFKIAGVLSSRLDVRNSPEVKADKYARVFSAQTPYVKLEPLVPEWPKIGDAMLTAIQEGLTGVKTPEAALKGAHEATNRALGVQ